MERVKLLGQAILLIVCWSVAAWINIQVWHRDHPDTPWIILVGVVIIVTVEFVIQCRK
jgi:hypothetical protein